MEELGQEFSREGPEAYFPLSMMNLFRKDDSVYFVFTSDNGLAGTFARRLNLSPITGFEILKARIISSK